VACPHSLNSRGNTGQSLNQAVIRGPSFVICDEMYTVQTTLHQKMSLNDAMVPLHPTRMPRSGANVVVTDRLVVLNIAVLVEVGEGAVVK
jgi:hypothetical protein